MARTSVFSSRARTPETATQHKHPEVQPPGDFGLAGRASRLFWFGFFLPVNILFHVLAYALLGTEPNLDHAVAVIVVIKTAYFGLVTYAVLALWAVWRASVEERRHRWLYLCAGLVSIVVFLAAHSERAYRFGILEREIGREVVKMNSGEAAALQAGVIPKVRVSERVLYYEFGLPGMSVSQLDLVKFRAFVRSSLVGPICSDPWTQRLVSANIAIHYVYRDRDGQLIADELFGKDTCVANH